MKRNKLFILGICTVMVALVSLSLVSGTWAKYTSTVSGSSAARVAKWDVVYTDNATNDTSGAVDTQTINFDIFGTIKDSNGSTENNVATGTNETLIAPGTKGEFQFSIRNDSEVNAKYSIDFELPTELANLPLVWSVVVSGNQTGSYDTFPADVTDVQFNMTHEVIYVITWEWPYETTPNTDAADTQHGIAPVSGSATIKITFTQVD